MDTSGDEQNKSRLDSKHFSLIDTYVNAGNIKRVRYFALIIVGNRSCVLITLIDASKL
jgi:hypothetical protein